MGQIGSVTTANGQELPMEVWAKERGISKETLDRLRVESGMAVFGSEQLPAIVFGYYDDGERVNYKARSLVSKLFKQQSGGAQRFYNLDKVLDGPMDVVYIVEGEMDALSLIEAGLPDNSVLSALSAPSQETDSPEQSQRYHYVLDALEQGLFNTTKFVICTDNDDPGRALRKDLVSLLGAAKCWFMDWPEGIKDANEALVDWGAEDLRHYINDAPQEWPVVGIYRMSDMPEPPKLELWSPGFPEWESKIKLAPTMLSVATGYPGHGKTQFWQQTWFQIAREHKIGVAIMSAETSPVPYVRRTFRQNYWSKLECDMSPVEKKEADDFIEEYFTFIQHPNSRPTFPWMMEMVENAAHRNNARAFICDPWNKLESDRGKKSETEWVGDCLDEVLDAARGLNMHIQILAHPSKQMGEFRKGPPAPDSISGSMHWWNRPDQLFAIHRPEVVDDDGMRKTEAVIYHHKARFEELGYPTKLNMKFNLATGRYESIDYKQGYET